MKSLLIDDDSFSLKLLERQMMSLGFTDIATQQSAHDAMVALKSGSGSFDLIACDLQMPDMDGVEFLRHLAAMGFTGDLILVSGEHQRILQSAQQLATAHGLNVLGALPKPVQREQLQRAIEERGARSWQSARKRDTAPRLLPADLRSAIEQGALVNYYQPKVSTATGRVTGVETLVRWQHPEHGLIFPDQFIPMAEANDLIDALMLSVLSAALNQTAAWDRAGLSLNVAVNVSMANLTSLDFPELVSREADRAGLDVRRLVLEVTESQVMKAPTIATEILTRLRLKGVGLSIDDFGTGHSSLAQLRDIPFDELKIDRGFVHGGATHHSRKAILDASADLAKKLGMKIVAEGVEDRADWDYVRAVGCDLAQGYFMAAGMPAHKVPDWHSTWTSSASELI